MCILTALDKPIFRSKLVPVYKVEIPNCDPIRTNTHLGLQELSEFNIEIYIGKMFKNLLLKNYKATICDITLQASSFNIDS